LIEGKDPYGTDEPEAVIHRALEDLKAVQLADQPQKREWVLTDRAKELLVRAILP
jgi:hypothetical protein